MEMAFAIIEEGGLDALTMPRLAERLECAVGAIYRYFPGKSSLLVGLQEQAISALSQDVSKAVKRARASTADKGLEPAEASLRHLIAAIESVRGLPQRSATRHRLIDELLSSPHALLSDEELQAVNVALSKLISQVTLLIEEAQLADALGEGNAQVRTYLVWASLHGLDHFRKRDRGEAPALRTTALAPELIRTLLRGFGAPQKLLQGVLPD